MGWKTNLIVLEGVIHDREALLAAMGRKGAIAKAQSTCGEAMFPPKALTIGTHAGCTLIGDPDLATDVIEKPDGIASTNLLAKFSDRQILVCTLHSVVNLAAFALFERGRLTRSFGVSSDDGVFKNIGEALPEEQRALSSYTQVTDEEGEVVLHDEHGETFGIDQVGEDIVFEVMSRLTGKRPDRDEALLKAPADVYSKPSFLASLFRR